MRGANVKDIGPRKSFCILFIQRPQKRGLCWSRARGKVHDRIEQKKGTSKNKCNVAEENRKIQGTQACDKAEKRQQYAGKIEIP